MSHDNDFLQQYLGDLNTHPQNASALPAVPADAATHSEHSSQGHGPTDEPSKPQQAPGIAQQSEEAEGQSTGPSGDSEAGASPQVKEIVTAKPRSMQPNYGHMTCKKRIAKLSGDLENDIRLDPHLHGIVLCAQRCDVAHV